MRSCLPISAIRMAMPTGSTLAMRTISRPDTSPMLTCGSKNEAASDAITMSAVVTRSSPAPAAIPLTAQITGLVIWRYGGVASCGGSHCRKELSRGSPCVSMPGAQASSSSVEALFTSAPTQSARPLPVMMSVHTLSVVSTQAYASRSSRTISSLMALRDSGRSSVMHTVCSRCSY